LIENDSNKKALFKVEQENQKLFRDIANMRKDFDNIERKLKNECSDKELVIRNKEITLESQINNLTTIYENRLMETNKQLASANAEIKKLKYEDENLK
jgi:hypothetical protein